MKQIPLTKGQVALVDDEDYEELSKYKWNSLWVKSMGSFYAQRSIWKDEFGKRNNIYMTRQIMGVIDPNIKVDHRDHCTLNNQRNNLRVCSDSQNLQNQKKKPDCSSKYKGIFLNRINGSWRSYIHIPAPGRSEKLCLGSFESEIDAAKAYDEAAKKYFGQFALLNFREN